MLLNLLILNPSDDQQAFMDKVNYNFDEILSMGGGPPGLQGIQGIQGIPGLQGIQGIQGPQGLPGSAWFVEPVDPTVLDLANDGDFWFNTNNLTVWEMISGTWTLVGTLATSNIFKYMSGLARQVMFDISAHNNTKALVLSSINYTNESQTGPYLLKVVGTSGPIISFGLEETEPGLYADWDGTAGEMLISNQPSIQVSKFAGMPDPYYSFEFHNPTGEFYVDVPSNNLSVDRDGSFDFNSTAMSFLLNTTGRPNENLINYSNALSRNVYPTVTNKLHFTVGAYPGGPYEELVTFADYGYIGINEVAPSFATEIHHPDTLGGSAGDLNNLMAVLYDKGGADLGLKTYALRYASGATAVRTYFQQNGAEVAFIQFNENVGGTGVIKFGSDVGVSKTDNYYFYGNDIWGNSGFGSALSTFVRDSTDNANLFSPIWQSTLNVETSYNWLSGQETNIESHGTTRGSIHLYQTANDNYYTGITTGGVGNDANTSGGVLFQDDSNTDGTKIHFVTADTNSILHNRMTIWGGRGGLGQAGGKIIQWSDTALSNPTHRYGLVTSVTDHFTAGVTSVVIRAYDLLTGQGNSTEALLRNIVTNGNKEANIVIAPKANLTDKTGFVGIGTTSDPVTKFQVEGNGAATTLGTRQAIGTYSSDVGDNSLAHGTNNAISGADSAVISGTNDVVEESWATIISSDNSTVGNGGQFSTIISATDHTVTGSHTTIIGAQPFANGITAAAGYTTTISTCLSILPAPISNTKANNTPLFYSRNLVAPNFNAATITIPQNVYGLGDARTNGLEVEQWYNSGAVSNDERRIHWPLLISSLDTDNTVFDRYLGSGFGVSTTVFSVDSSGRTNINTNAFATSAPSTSNGRYVPYHASLNVGPANYTVGGNNLPDAYRGNGSDLGGDYRRGAGSIIISAPDTSTSGPTFLSANGASREHAVIGLSSIRHDSGSAVHGRPLEIHAGKTLNGGAGEAYGSALKITAGEGGAPTADSYGGNLMLYGGYGGNYGGHVKISSGTGTILSGNVDIDAVDINLTAADDVNITAADDITITGEVHMVRAPTDSCYGLTTAYVGGGTTSVWGGNFSFDTPGLLVDGILINAAPYDRFLNLHAAIFSDGFFWLELQINSVTIASVRCSWSWGWADNWSQHGFFVPAGQNVNLHVHSTSSPGFEPNGQLNFIETRLGL